MYTIKCEARAELEEKRSRFLAFLVPIAHFETRLAELKIEHRKANHHVTAFRRVLNDGRIEEGAKDDGEPGGTSGMPVLKTIIGADLVDAGIIVVRYFGGTKLGTGGLARAYSGAAGLAVETATLDPWHQIVRKKIVCEFATASEIENQIQSLGLTVVERIFTETGVEIAIEGADDLVARIDA